MGAFNHYDPAIDGEVTDRGASFPVPAGTEELVEDGKGLYTRAQVKDVVSGEVETSTGVYHPEPTRIWPGEPAVGWLSDDMSFFVDGAVRIGGPTLKTYVLNDKTGSHVSLVREARIEMDDTYRKLRASEDRSVFSDVLNSIGTWESTNQIVAPGTLAFTSETNSDSRTFSWNGSDTITLLRRGVYLITYRAFGTPNAGLLRTTLTADGTSYQWRISGGPTTTSLSDMALVTKTTDSESTVTLSLASGTDLGGSGVTRTILSIVKVR